MNRLLRLPHLVAVTVAVLFLLVLSSGTASAQVIVPVDIKPGSCPNPINLKSNGVLPVAILGTDTLDVNDIDFTTILLEGVSPLRSSVEDVATPFGPLSELPDEFECNDFGPDGFPDLTLKFSTQAVVGAVSVVNGVINEREPMFLNLMAELFDGTVITGEDVVVILKKGNGGRSALAPGRNK